MKKDYRLIALFIFSLIFLIFGLIDTSMNIINFVLVIAAFVINKNRYKKIYEESVSATSAANIELQKLDEQKINVLRKIADLNQKMLELQNEIDSLNNKTIINYSFSTVSDAVTSEEYKTKLSVIRAKQIDLVKSSRAINMFSDNSKKVTNNNIKQLLRCFNSECTSIIEGVSIRNFDACAQKIQKSFDALNKIFETDGVSLTFECLELKFEELNMAHNLIFQKDQEKEQQRYIKEQMAEEEKVRREIEKEKLKIEKEERQFNNELHRLRQYYQQANDIEKQIYLEKINELEDKLKILEVDRHNVFERELNTRSGYVYIISNIGSFGENVYKIGMTRRLEPMDRVNELSSASVPFPFDVHAMIFSEDAPALETTLHNTFRDYQINKINPRKEFFKIDINEIEKTVLDCHNATVTFTKLALAEQYRASIGCVD